jgi:glucose 1-dehydrogenase
VGVSAALVTGAAGGIGRAICLVLAHQARCEGSHLSIAVAGSRPGPGLDALVDELRGLGARAQPLVADVTDAAACNQLVARAQEACGGDLTLLVSNAGASGPGTLAALSVEQWDRTFNLNCRATLLLAQAAREGLARTRGSIVAVASMSGLHPHPGYGAYSAAKAALVMLCRQLAQEWAGEGIRVNAVCPGMIRTPLTERIYREPGLQAQREALVPLGRIGTPEDVAQAVLYLASPGAAYVTGQALTVDGGISDHMLTLIPGRTGK